MTTYRDLIASMGVENLLQVDDNDYQGDSRILVRDYHRYGLLLFGWGSCSGCDAPRMYSSWAPIAHGWPTRSSCRWPSWSNSYALPVAGS